MHSKTLIHYNYWFLLSTSACVFFPFLYSSPHSGFLIFLFVLSVPFLLFLFFISALLLCLCLFLSSSFFHSRGISESHLGVRASRLEKRARWVAPVFRSGALSFQPRMGSTCSKNANLKFWEGALTDTPCNRKGPLDRKTPNVVDSAHPSPSNFLVTMCALKRAGGNLGWWGRPSHGWRGTHECHVGRACGLRHRTQLELTSVTS